MKTNKFFSWMLCAFLLFGMLIPGAGAAEEAGNTYYAESIIEIPEAYQDHVEGMGARGDTVYIVASTEDSGTSDLLIYEDIAQAPRIMPLALDIGEREEEGRVSWLISMDISPDGYLALLVSESDIINNPELALEAPENEEEAEPKNEEEAESDEEEDDIEEEETVDVNRELSMLFISLEDGSVVSSFIFEEDEIDLIYRFSALGNGIIATFDYQTGARLYDAEGDEVAELSYPDFIGVIGATENGTFYVVANGYIYELDAETGEEIDSYEIGNQVYFFYNAVVGADGDIYSASSMQGLSRYSFAEQSIEVLAKNMFGSILTDNNAYNEATAVLSDGSFVLLMRSRVGQEVEEEDAEPTTRLVRYTPTERDASSKTKFVITTISETYSLQNALNEFQRRHPEVEIVMSIDRDWMMSVSSMDEYMDMIHAVNTDILAGNGGDLFILDSLPMQTYINKGVLEDITEVADKIDLFVGIHEGLKDKDGKIYALPLLASIDLMWGNKELLDSITKLEDLLDVKPEEDQVITFPKDRQNLFGQFYESNDALFKDEQGVYQFNNGKFEAYVNFIENLYVLMEEQPNVQDILAEEDFMKLYELQRGMLSNGDTLIEMANSMGIMDFILNNFFVGEEGGFKAIPSMEGESNAYVPLNLMAINSKSEQKELAKEFIEIALTLEQETMGMGVPVTEKQLQANIDIYMAIEGYMAFAISFGQGTEVVEVSKPSQEAWDALVAFMHTVTSPVIMDNEISSFIAEGLKDFFEGNGSVQDAVNAVEQKAWLYQNE